MRRSWWRFRNGGEVIRLHLAAAAAVAVLAAAPTRPAGAEAMPSEGAPSGAALERFEGVVRPTAGLGIAQIRPEEIGSLRIEAEEPGTDLRELPGEVVLEMTDGSTLRAAPGVANIVRFDPDSGLRLAPDAPPDAVCTTGQEPDCWQPEDPVTVSLGLFDALCDLTRGFLSGDPSACIMDFPALAFPEGDAFLDLLTPEQQALLGCGPLFETDCGLGDLDLFALHPNLLLFLLALGIDVPITEPTQPSPSPLDPLLPGARSVAEDGSEMATAAWEALRTLTAVSELGSPSSVGDECSPATSALCHPFIGSQFSSEIEALSFNVLIALVLASSVGSSSDPDCTLATPELCDGEFDLGDPFGIGRCSFTNPEGCELVRALLSLISQSVRELDDDPDGPPRERWLWQSGSEHPIVEATGSLAAFQGGTLHLAGPEVSRVPGTSRGAPLILVPPEGAAQPLVADSPLVRTAAAGPDGEPESGDETALGLGYVVALPEPSESLLGAVAVAVLAVLARERRGRGGAAAQPGRPS